MKNYVSIAVLQTFIKLLYEFILYFITAKEQYKNAFFVEHK